MSEETKEVKMKRCNKGEKCVTGNPLQPITSFSKRKNSPDGHTYTCKECEKVSARASYERRKDKIKQRQYHQEHREERLAYHKEYYKKNREKKLAYDKKYQASKEGKKVMQLAHAKRRQALAENKGTPYERHEIIARDSVNGVLYCKACNEPIEKLADLHIDHIVPISEGGKDCKENVRSTHKWCNLNRPKDARDLKAEEDANDETKQLGPTDKPGPSES